MKKITLLSALVISCLYVAAQEKPVKSLTIGDTIPSDLVLTNVYNSPVSEIPLSDLRGKLVILDFWATWCGACITQFPHLQKLQERFGDSLQILLVNAKSVAIGDTPAKIDKTLSGVQQRTGQAFTLPVVYNNPLLDTLFPYTIIPHEVWIWNNKILAITSALELNEPNIEAVLNNQPVAMRTKKDHLPGERNPPLLAVPNPQGLLFRSILTGFQEGYSGEGSYPDETNRTRITGLYYYNNTLESLLRDAATHTSLLQYPSNRLVVEMKAPAPFLQYTDTARYRHLYCYELRLPATSFAEARNWMLQDLTRSFHIELRNQIRTIPCLVVQATDKLKKARTRGGESTLDVDPGTPLKFLRNYRVADALALLDRFSSLPLINETCTELSIDLDLPFDLAAPGQLIRALEIAGFRVERTQRPLEITLITDSDDF